MTNESSRDGSQNLHPDVNAEIDAHAELPRFPKSFFEPGDEVILDCLSRSGDPCQLSWQVDESSPHTRETLICDPDDDPADYQRVTVTITGNTSRSPARVGEQYVLTDNTATSRGTLGRMDDAFEKGSYQWLVPEEKSLHEHSFRPGFRTSFISDVTILRHEGDQDVVIKPFEVQQV